MTENTLPQNAPNRYETIVSVEVHPLHGEDSYVTFSDLQLAYMWIEEQLSANDELKNFLDIAETLDAAVNQVGVRRAYVAVASTPTVQYGVFYGKLLY